MWRDSHKKQFLGLLQCKLDPVAEAERKDQRFLFLFLREKYHRKY